MRGWGWWVGGRGGGGAWGACGGVEVRQRGVQPCCGCGGAEGGLAAAAASCCEAGRWLAPGWLPNARLASWRRHPHQCTPPKQFAPSTAASKHRLQAEHTRAACVLFGPAVAQDAGSSEARGQHNKGLPGCVIWQPPAPGRDRRGPRLTLGLAGHAGIVRLSGEHLVQAVILEKVSLRTRDVMGGHCCVGREGGPDNESPCHLAMPSASQPILWAQIYGLDTQYGHACSWSQTADLETPVPWFF